MKPFKKKTVLITFFISLGIFLLMGAFIVYRNSLKGKNIIKVGFVNYPAPFFIAYKKGFFDDEGLVIEKIDIGSKDISANALITGDVDTIPLTYSTLFSMQNTTPGIFRIYCGTYETEEYPFSYLLVKPEIESFTDLIGKKLVTRTSYSGRIQAESIIKNAGLNLNDVEIVQVEKPLLISTFSKDDIAAIIDQEPTMTIITQQNVGKVLVSAVRAKYIIDPFPSATCVFRSKFVEEHPELARKFKKAIDRAIDYMNNNEDECRKIFEEELNLDHDIAAKMKLSRYQLLEDIDRNSVQELLNYEVENEILKQRPDFNDVYYED